MRFIRSITAVMLLLFAARVAPAQDAAGHITAGDAAQDAFRPTEALQHYQAAIAIDSAHAEAFGKASRSAVDVAEAEANETRRRELYRQAMDYARRAIALDSTKADWHFNAARALGRLALSVGVRERVRYAVEIREQAMTALKLEPDHPGALHVLGMWHAEVKRLNRFERFFAQNFLGGRVFGLANWNDAVKNLERAVEVDGDRIVHHLDLAMIYADIGQKAKAREQLEFVVASTRQTDFNDPLYKKQAEAALKRLR